VVGGSRGCQSSPPPRRVGARRVVTYPAQRKQPLAADYRELQRPVVPRLVERHAHPAPVEGVAYQRRHAARPPDAAAAVLQQRPVPGVGGEFQEGLPLFPGRGALVGDRQVEVMESVLRHGGGAVVVVHPDLARDLKKPPVIYAGRRLSGVCIKLLTTHLNEVKR